MDGVLAGEGVGTGARDGGGEREEDRGVIWAGERARNGEGGGESEEEAREGLGAEGPGAEGPGADGPGRYPL